VITFPAFGGSDIIDLDSGLGHVSINHILLSASNLIAATSYGNLWLSSDSGSSWSEPSTAPAVGVYGLGQHNGKVYAMSSSGIYSSADNGASWALISAAETGHFSEFASDANNRLYIFGGGGVKFSDDGGANWTAFSTGVLDCRGRSTDHENGLAVSADGQNIYANECYSSDAGASWAESVFIGTSTRVIHSMVLDTAGNVLAGKNLGGVEKSSDGGANYVLSNGGMDTFGNNPAGISTMYRDSRDNFYALAPLGVGAFLSGVWSSVDGGANWIRENNGLPVVPRQGEFGALAMTEGASGQLILSTAGTGLFSSASAGSAGGGRGGTADTTAPVVSVPANITVAADSASGTAATHVDIAAFLSAATANDDIDGSISVSHDAPATFPAGTTTSVSFTASDAAGNTATATADITIEAFNDTPAGTTGTGGGSTTTDSSSGGGAFGLFELWLFLLTTALACRRKA